MTASASAWHLAISYSLTGALEPLAVASGLSGTPDTSDVCELHGALLLAVLTLSVSVWKHAKGFFIEGW